MKIEGRREDLSKVFDRTWKANHNDVAKRGREKEKKFLDKMFNTNLSGNSKNTNSNSVNNRVNNLNNNMNSTFDFQRKNNLNNIGKKW